MAPVLTRCALVAALAGGVLVASPAGSSARSLDHTDARGDVTTIFGESFEYIAAPGEVKSDVLRTRFQHTTSRVRVRMKFLDVHKDDDIRYHVRVAVRTNEGLRRTVRLDFNPGYWQGRAKMLVLLPRTGEERKVRCAIHTSVNDTTNVVVIGFPRACLSRPRWIRIGAISGADVPEGATNNFLDDVLKNGTIDYRSSTTLTHRLYQGHHGR